MTAAPRMESKQGSLILARGSDFPLKRLLTIACADGIARHKAIAAALEAAGHPCSLRQAYRILTTGRVPKAFQTAFYAWLERAVAANTRIPTPQLPRILDAVETRRQLHAEHRQLLDELRATSRDRMTLAMDTTNSAQQARRALWEQR